MANDQNQPSTEELLKQYGKESTNLTGAVSNAMSDLPAPSGVHKLFPQAAGLTISPTKKGGLMISGYGAIEGDEDPTVNGRRVRVQVAIPNKNMGATGQALCSEAVARLGTGLGVGAEPTLKELHDAWANAKDGRIYVNVGNAAEMGLGHMYDVVDVVDAAVYAAFIEGGSKRVPYPVPRNVRTGARGGSGGGGQAGSGGNAGGDDIPF